MITVVDIFVAESVKAYILDIDILFLKELEKRLVVTQTRLFPYHSLFSVDWEMVLNRTY